MQTGRWETALTVTQSSNGISHILPYILQHHPKEVDSYLNEHGILSFGTQQIMAEAIRYYNKGTFKWQRIWCSQIAVTPGLGFELYNIAARYFMRIGEYDTAMETCHIAETCTEVTNDPEGIALLIECLKVDVDYYREVPFWPTRRELKLELAEIYDAKGIPHPRVIVRGNTTRNRFTTRSGGQGEMSDGAEGTVTGQPHIKCLPEEKLAEVLALSENLDYADNSDGKYSRFVDVQAFDISGIGPATIDALIDSGKISTFGDIFRLKYYREELIACGAFTEKKVDSMLAAIEKARTISDVKFLVSLSIPGLSEDTIRRILKQYPFEKLLEIGERHDDLYQLATVEWVGPYTSVSILGWFENDSNTEMLRDLRREVTIKETKEEDIGNRCQGLVFVVTGDVHIFKRRDDVKNYICSQGGTMGQSINSKTNYLINNDIDSPSVKNKKAKAAGVPIISEEEFVEKFGFPDN